MKHKPMALRQKIRQLRNDIPNAYALQASYRLSEQVATLPVYEACQSISAFLPFDGEVSPLPLMDRAIQDGKRVWVPVMRGKATALQFAPWERDAPMKKNGFGIDEPDVPESDWIMASELDLALLPLVAFDASCNRLGVGGGYYDRSFAFAVGAPLDQRPFLVGLGYELQRVPQLHPEKWDVPLDSVVTELQIYRRED